MKIEDRTYGEADPAWSEYKFTGAAEQRASSLYNNHRSKFEKCALKITKGNAVYVVEPATDLAIKLWIEGGSLAPRIRISLVVGDINEPELIMEAVFFAWSHRETDTPRAPAIITSAQAAQGRFTFSSHLSNLQWVQPVNLRPQQLQANAALLGQSPAAVIRWNYAQPICMNFDCPVRLDGTKGTHAQAIADFMSIRNGSRIEVLTKVSRKLVRKLAHLTSEILTISIDRDVQFLRCSARTDATSMVAIRQTTSHQSVCHRGFPER